MRRKDWLLIGALTTIFSLALGFWQWWKYSQFGYNGLDLGIYAQTVWGLSHGGGFLSSIHDPSYLGDHLELGLAPLAALYRLFPSPLTLLWSQTVILASSVFPLVMIADRLVGRRTAVLAGVVWLLHPLLYNALMYEFHGLAFALPILLWSIVAYLNGRVRWWLFSLLLLVLVREDMPLVVAGWAVLALIDRRGWRWWVPAILLAGVWFCAAQTIISHAQPAGTYKYLAFYRWLGDSYGEILTYPFRHPWIFAQHLFQVRNWLTLAGFLLTFGFLPIFRPRFLVPVGLVYFQLLLTGAAVDSVLRIHYVLPYLPFLAWATLAVIREVRANRLFTRLPAGIGLIMVSAIAVIGPLYSQFAFGAAENTGQAGDSSSRTPAAVLRWAVNQVPDDSAVLTTFNLLPYLANRQQVYSLNYLHLGRRQYSETPYHLPTAIDVVVIDWQQYFDYQFLYKDTLFKGRTGVQRLKDLLAGQGLSLSAWVDGVAIYNRRGDDPYQPTAMVNRLPTAPDAELVIVDEPEIGAIELPTGIGAGRQYEVSSSWAVKEQPRQPWSIVFTATQNGKTVWQSARVLGQGVWPADGWLAKEVWVANYRLLIPSTVSGPFALSARVVEYSGRMRIDRDRGFYAKISSARDILSVDFGAVN